MSAIGASALLTLASTSHAQGSPLDQMLAEEPDGNTLVTPSFVVPDRPLERGTSSTPTHLGVKLSVAADWHIYWQNNGSSGAPPSFEWSAPDGVEIGAPRWPVPERKLLFGGEAVDYVYHGAPVLLFPVTVDPSFEGEFAEISLSVSWLVCKSVCLFGEGEIDVTVPVADPAPRTTVISDELADIMDTMPRRTLPADVSLVRRGAIVAVRAPGAESLAFLPHRHEQITMSNESKSGAAEGETLRFLLDGPPGALEEFSGVLVIERGGDRRGYRVDSMP
ncbi:MAG: protein-disulfide reductase DsbD domain-containing protein [Planctomycetota bacterium]